jgi:rRNA maturation protein Rpf1
MRQAIILLIMTFLFASGCGPSDPPSFQEKPTKKDLSVEEKTQKPLRIVFYDFDQTLPVIHIFHETNGADDVSEISDQFFVDAFGGEERIERLKKHFERLAQAKVKCSIVSYSYTAVIKESLTRVGLIDFFAKEAIFGRDSEALKRFNGAKHKVISEEMRLGKIGHEEAIFIDDSKKNIEECEEDGTCRFLHVHERRGLTEKDLLFLENELIKE